jgi:hypothetical protein
METAKIETTVLVAIREWLIENGFHCTEVQPTNTFNTVLFAVRVCNDDWLKIRLLPGGGGLIRLHTRNGCRNNDYELADPDFFDKLRAGIREMMYYGIKINVPGLA